MSGNSACEVWQGFLDISNQHVGILEDKFYAQSEDESRAPELWENSSMWLKVERLINVRVDVVKECQANLRELADDLLGPNEPG